MAPSIVDKKTQIVPRPVVGKFEPYLPGRSLEQVKREYGLKSVVKLASNENPLGPSPRALAAARKAAAAAHLYPDGFSTDLRMAVARHAGVPSDRVVLGAGSDEIIALLGLAYLSPGDEIIVGDHAFIRYRMAADMMGASTVSVPMPELAHDLPAMARAVTPRTKMVFVANPNNPTGTYNTAAQVEALSDALPPSVLLVLDEAYYEYAREKKDYADGLALLKGGRNLMVLRTFSKAYGLAGLRVGWGAGPAEVVDALERIRPPFNLNVAAQAAGVAALADQGRVRRSVRLMASEMRKMEAAFRARGVEWTPSAGNFLLIKVAPLRGQDVFEALLKRGVIIRAMDEYGLPGHIRVTLGLPAENRLFLKEFLNLTGRIGR
jgi:histidinol-phosphate aminotransferase